MNISELFVVQIEFSKSKNLASALEIQKEIDNLYPEVEKSLI